MKTITHENFVRYYMEIHKTNGTIKDLAQRVSIPVAVLRARTYALRSKGVNLPKLKSAVATLDVASLNSLIDQA